VPLFAPLEAATVNDIATRGWVLTLEQGRVLFNEGDAGDSLYVVLRGALRLYRRDDRGNELELGVQPAGSHVGELALLDGGSRSASAVAAQRTTCFALGREAFLAQLRQSPEILPIVLAQLTSIVRTTTERLFEDELQRQRVAADAAAMRYESLARMVAGVAHEVNTPLALVHTAADFVDRRLSEALGPDSDQNGAATDVRRALQLIGRNIRRADRLVQDFKKLSASQIHDVREQVDIVAVVEETVDLFSVSARRAGLRVAVRSRVEPGERRLWLGYRGYLSQVLLNLLTNVERHAYAAGEPATASVEIERHGDEFVLSVHDEGRGIAEPDLARVFDPFFTTSRERGGTGLGLAIVHNLVTSGLHGGIALQSRPGVGTTVVVTLPCAVPEPA